MTGNLNSGISYLITTVKHEFFGGKSALCQFSSSSKSEVTLIQLPKKHNGATLHNFLELAITAEFFTTTINNYNRKICDVLGQNSDILCHKRSCVCD